MTPPGIWQRVQRCEKIWGFGAYMRRIARARGNILIQKRSEIRWYAPVAFLIMERMRRA